jgi:hypothetical protein
MLPGKAPFLMRPRGAGRAVAVEDSLSLIQGCRPPGGDRQPARNGPRQESGWAHLGRGATGAGATVKQSRSERPYTGATSAPTDQCSAVTAEFSTA